MSINHLNFDLSKPFDQKSSSFEEIPERTGDIKRVHVIEKLESIGISRQDLSLGDFDQIGEATARKKRNPDSRLYKEKGAFFRPNYERGILIYHLIKNIPERLFWKCELHKGNVPGICSDIE